ncbi:MAG: DUF4446 family protein [Actinobacteria bacterium]|nr:DUF4446 family protein [Actinomycetota bacterium]
MTTPDGLYDWLALAAAATALLALLLLVVNAVTLRRLRRAQKLVLAGSERDIVTHAADLQREFVTLRDWLDETAGAIDERMSAAERRLDGSIAHTAMIRYDAYGELTGRQSSSVALVDDTRTGVIVTAIRHRSHSHLYVKQLRNGESDIELSPEERQVLEQAFSERPVAPPPADAPPPPPRGPASQAQSDTAPPTPETQSPPDGEPRVSIATAQQAGQPQRVGRSQQIAGT